MWRWLLGALVVANLFVMLLWRGSLDGVFTSGREPHRLEQQLQADRLRVIAPDAKRGDARGPAGGDARPDGRSDARPDARGEPRSDARPESSRGDARDPRDARDARADARPEPRAERRTGAAPVEELAAGSALRAPATLAGETCVEFGGLDEQRARRARAWLAEHVGDISGEVLAEERGYWLVYLAPAPNLADAQVRASLLKRQGVDDLFVWQDGPMKYAISLGLYRTEEGARAAVEQFARQGVRNALVMRRGSPDARVVVRVRYPTRSGDASGTPAKLAQLQRDLVAQPHPCGTRATVADAGRADAGRP